MGSSLSSPTRSSTLLNADGWMERSCKKAAGLPLPPPAHFPLPDPITEPSFQTLVSLLRSCSSSKILSHGKHVHAIIRRRGLDSSPVLGGLLVQMYSDCGGLLQDACSVFANIHPRSVFAWNVMIRAYAMHGQNSPALWSLRQMHAEGLQPNKITFITLLSVCSREGAIFEGRKVHVSILENDFLMCLVVRNGLLNVYCKSDCLQEAQREFDAMDERNVVSWTSIMSALLQNNAGEFSLRYFHRMQQESVLPDNIAFLTVLDACAGQVDLEEGKRIHACIVSCRLDLDVIVGTSIVNLYSKCGYPELGKESFNIIPDKNLMAWTANIEMHAHNARCKEALQAYEQMLCEGVTANKFTIVNVLDAVGHEENLSRGRQIHAMIVGFNIECDSVVDTAIINMYGKCHKLDEAEVAFYKINQKVAITWAAFIAVLVQNQEGQKALEYFTRMVQEGIKPNKVVFVSAFDACASMVSLGNGKCMHVQVLENQFDCNIFVNNAIIDMYGKCGSLPDAWTVFDQMRKRDRVTWNTMVTTCARHGHGKMAFDLFYEMLRTGVVVDEVSFLTIISSCSHAGLVDDGVQCFTSMYENYGVKPLIRHCNSLIDLLTRAGRLNEAEKFTKVMWPRPNSVSLMTLLGACKQLAEVALGERITKCLDLDSQMVI